MTIITDRGLENEDELDAVFHALSDRTRRALVRRLSRGPAKITELAGPFSMTLAAVSKHVRVLEAADLVRREVDGRVHQCSLSAAPMLKAEKWLKDYATFWENSLDSLNDYVESRK